MNLTFTAFKEIFDITIAKTERKLDNKNVAVQLQDICRSALLKCLFDHKVLKCESHYISKPWVRVINYNEKTCYYCISEIVGVFRGGMRWRYKPEGRGFDSR
jgi:hypothetical protein